MAAKVTSIMMKKKAASRIRLQTEGQYMSVAAIYKELKPKYGATLVGNSLISFGRKLKNIDGITHRHSSDGTEYLIVRRY